MSKNNNREKAPKRAQREREEAPRQQRVEWYSEEDCHQFLNMVRKSFYWLYFRECENIVVHMENLIEAFKEHLDIYRSLLKEREQERKDD